MKIGKLAQAIVRNGIKASIATFDKATGHPYVSLTATATAPSGHPLFLLSGLARHTQNIAKDNRASVLYDATGERGDPMAGDRITLVGWISALQTDGDVALARRRFLARHPDAAQYVDFADFRFYRLEPEFAHLIGGFGRIVDISGEDLLTCTATADALIAAESEIVAHMNADHADAVADYALGLLGADPADGPWRMTGLDPTGVDITGSNGVLRLEFPETVTTPDQARQTLVVLVKEARKTKNTG